ncbi:hypothetical protein NY2A_b333L [Paramecium bursaria Chlorella virus NY2A]|uniref:Uncharacterized protein b333L n=1 Tax=Paramecium bursaria Chlorella virus NY2A TaxID=46021 RepID=A7IWK8_PBCVN|nr:hypothetical protein NY2A_b333L [Paramecium bursaria Chlorella virus NY2A]YP_001498383.1 hypothetical protein AR158_C302L [Paramecium bursaria Chlorella virus AR158]ABT14732.1 hypothetical protein NY2A_b333L [Paramecium bursaria Chlorella virus NY2A]ABU43847.1 hypothetical protein AR158_C302L [Paramecium bursaria Chlorella virus AR158]
MSRSLRSRSFKSSDLCILSTSSRTSGFSSHRSVSLECANIGFGLVFVAIMYNVIPRAYMSIGFPIVNNTSFLL